jgi:hypothetical protein
MLILKENHRVCFGDIDKDTVDRKSSPEAPRPHIPQLPTSTSLDLGSSVLAGLLSSRAAVSWPSPMARVCILFSDTCAWRRPVPQLGSPCVGCLDTKSLWTVWFDNSPYGCPLRLLTAIVHDENT